MKKSHKKGHFIISLDFEKLWGVRDKRKIEDFGDVIKNVPAIIETTLDLFERYNVKATFSTVGLLFAESKEEMLRYCPDLKPSYVNANLSPYNGHFELIESSRYTDPYHFAPESILLIKSYGQDIGTHTFSHYYCLEKGQTVDQFKADLNSAVSIAKKNGIELTSIIFPRNNVNPQYLDILKDFGIKFYRGNLNHWAYETRNQTFIKSLLQRPFRYVDAYVNLSGYNTYELQKFSKNVETPIDIPASRFLRPFSARISFLEALKIKRIKSSMSEAAKKGKMYHLWWHPHNFGTNTEDNFKNLVEILEHYKVLSQKFGFESNSMESVYENNQRFQFYRNR